MPTFTKSLVARKWEVFAALEEAHDFLEGCGLSARQRNAVELSAEELLSNVWKYAFPGGEPGAAALSLDVDGGLVRLEVSDAGAPFDPTLVPSPPPPPPSLDGAPGGRGIHLVRSLSSTFLYRREGSRNVVAVEFRAT